ncbi:hypothetical protein [Candidatus Pyrohabitans sp.]
MPSELDRILSTYSGVEEVQKLFCIDNIEWSYELPYYLRDVRIPRNNLYPGASRRVYRLEGKIGVIDLRAHSEASFVCEAYLPIPKTLKAMQGEELMVKDSDEIFCSCARMYSLRDFGVDIECVPFFMPDGKLSACAQAAMKTMVTHFSREFDTPNISMPQIQKKVSEGDPFGSYGLTAGMVYRGFSEISGKVLYYIGRENPEIESFPEYQRMDSSNLYAYIESELPVYLVFKTKDLWWWDEQGDETYHAIVGIGHTLDENGRLDYFIAHDVSYGPYRLLPVDTVDEKLVEAIVVLPPKVNVRFENAYFSMIFSAFGLNDLLKEKLKRDLTLDVREKIENGEVVFRSMLVSSTKVKEWYSDPTDFYGVRKTTRDVYISAELPTYSWLFELKEKGRRDNRNFAQILINATEGSPKPCLINFPDGALRYRSGLEEMLMGGPDALKGDPGLRKDMIYEKWRRIQG